MGMKFLYFIRTQLQISDNMLRLKVSLAFAWDQKALKLRSKVYFVLT